MLKTLLIRFRREALIAGIALSCSTSAYSQFGFCPTTPPYGIVPCDFACIGSAMVTGSSQLSSAFASHVAQLNTISSQLSECVVKVNTLGLQTQSQLATSASTLGISITEMGQREVSAIDAIIIKVSDVAAKYVASSAKLTLELINSIISNTKAFLGLYTIKYQYETPSAVGIDMSSQFLAGLQRTDQRLLDLNNRTLVLTEYMKAYGDVLGTAGQNGSMIKEQNMHAEDLETALFANAAEYFSVPSFHPTNIQSYTTADLMLADLYSKNEFACIAWSAVLPNSSHPCTQIGIDDQVTPDEVRAKSEEAQVTLQEAIANSMDEATEQGFMAQLELSGKQCLDAIMGLNMEASLVDPTSAGYVAVFNQVRDFLIDQGCQILNTAIQDQVAATKQKILDVGNVIKEKSMGEIAIEVNSNDTQTIDLLLDQEADGERIGLYGLRFFGDVPEGSEEGQGQGQAQASTPGTQESEQNSGATEWSVPQESSSGGNSNPYDLPGGGWGISDETWETLL